MRKKSVWAWLCACSALACCVMAFGDPKGTLAWSLAILAIAALAFLPLCLPFLWREASHLIAPRVARFKHESLYLRSSGHR